MSSPTCPVCRMEVEEVTHADLAEMGIMDARGDRSTKMYRCAQDHLSDEDDVGWSA